MTDSVDYDEGLRAAWLGEQRGKAFFEQLAEATADATQRAKWGVLAKLEEVTGKCLEPLVRMDQEAPAGANAKLTAGAATSYAQLPLAVALRQMKSVVDPAIDRFELLLKKAPEAHREVVQILVDHEVALRIFVDRELAGDSAKSLDATHAVIARASLLGGKRPAGEQAGFAAR